MRQEQSGEIRFCYVENDGSDENMMFLTGLKNIFSKQLPNMPKVRPPAQGSVIPPSRPPSMPKVPPTHTHPPVSCSHHAISPPPAAPPLAALFLRNISVGLCLTAVTAPQPS